MTSTPDLAAPSLSVRTPPVVWRAVLLAVLALASWRWTGRAGALAFFPLLGVVPGLAIVSALGLATGATGLALGIVLAPLVSALLGWGLLACGVAPASAALAIAAASGLAWLVAGGPRVHAPRLVLPRGAFALAIALAVVVAVPPLVNRYILVRGDTWTHAGIAMQILERGVPPEEPRFAGIPIHYPWFYNLFAVLVGATHEGDPFVPMAALNVATAFATVALTAALALRVWRQTAAATAAACLIVFGLNAGAWLLWPLRLVQTLTGSVRGLAEVHLQLHTIEPGTARIIYSLSAPYASMVSMLDKLLVGSPLAYGYLLMLGWIWAVTAWLVDGRVRDLVLLAACAAGTLFFHGVVGMSVVPVGGLTLLTALVLRARLSWLPSASRLIAAGIATAVGALLATPYFLSVASGWRSGESGLQHRYLAIGATMPWTLLTACAVVVPFAIPAVRRAWSDRDPARAMIALFAVAMLGFALLVQLPEHNEAKFVWQVFVPAVVLVAPAFAAWFQRAWTARPAMTALGSFVLAGVPFLLTCHGYIVDPGAGSDPTVVARPGEEALYRWIREHTPRDAVLVDHGFRDVIMVKGARVLYLGTAFGPERAAFPMRLVRERRQVVADLYGPVDALDADLASLRRFGRPLYVVFRPDDAAVTGPALQRLERRTDAFTGVYDAGGYRVLRLADAGSGS